MKNPDFGAYIKSIRVSKAIPQRLVAHKLDIDTSTLSKIELGDRPITINMIKGLSEALSIDFKSLQIKFLTDKILWDFSSQPYFIDALNNILTLNTKMHA